MINFKSLFDDGKLTDLGKEVFGKFASQVEEFITNSSFKYMTSSEIQAIGVLMSSIVGNSISNHMQIKYEFSEKFNKMSDEEFEAYLLNKYGPNYMLTSLTSEEYERIEPYYY